jgi:subtilisin
MGLLGASGIATASGLSVSTGARYDPGDTFVTMRGELDALGGASAADVSFEWRRTGAGDWNETPSQSRSSTGEFGRKVTGLQEATEYEYRALAAGSNGASDTGEITSFHTSGDPQVWTHRVEEVTKSSATLYAQVGGFGGADTLYGHFRWGEEGEGLPNATPTDEAFWGQWFYWFVIGVDGLDRNTTYEFRAVGEASDGDVDTGDVLTFTTDGR